MLLRFATHQSARSSLWNSKPKSSIALPNHSSLKPVLPKNIRNFSAPLAKFSGTNDWKWRSHQRESEERNFKREEITGYYLGGLLLLASGVILSSATSADEDEEKIEPLKPSTGQWRDDLPIFTRAEVSKHKTMQDRYDMRSANMFSSSHSS